MNHWLLIMVIASIAVWRMSNKTERTGFLFLCFDESLKKTENEDEQGLKCIRTKHKVFKYYWP